MKYQYSFIFPSNGNIDRVPIDTNCGHCLSSFQLVNFVIDLINRWQNILYTSLKATENAHGFTQETGSISWVHVIDFWGWLCCKRLYNLLNLYFKSMYVTFF